MNERRILGRPNIDLTVPLGLLGPTVLVSVDKGYPQLNGGE